MGRDRAAKFETRKRVERKRRVLDAAGPDALLALLSGSYGNPRRARGVRVESRPRLVDEEKNRFSPRLPALLSRCLSRL